MSEFEFAFSLFGLVLGLAVATVVGGFGRVLKARREVRLGWLTPLLGLLLLVDLVTFWEGAWQMRAAIPISFEALLAGTAIASIYYLAALLVFPDVPGEWPDLDDWFLEHKGQVMAGVLAANLAMTACELLLRGNPSIPWPLFAAMATYSAAALGLILTRSKVLSLALLLSALSLYLVLPFVVSAVLAG